MSEIVVRIELPDEVFRLGWALVEALNTRVAETAARPKVLKQDSVVPVPRDGADGAASNGQQPAPPAAGVSSLNSPPGPKAPAVFSKVEKKPVVFTAARVQKIVDMKAQNASWKEILEALREMAGAPIGGVSSVSGIYFGLKGAGKLPKPSTGAMRELEILEGQVKRGAVILSRPPPPVPTVKQVEPAPHPAEPPPLTAKQQLVRSVAKTIGEVVKKPGYVPPPRPPVAQPGAVVRMSHAEVRQWASQRGLCNGADGDFDLFQVNLKRGALGLPKIELTKGRA